MPHRLFRARALAWSAGACLLAGLATRAPLPFAPPPAYAQGADVDTLAQRVDELREAMESLYLDAEQDHGRVRAATFEPALQESPFAGVISKVVAAARADPEAPADALVDAALADPAAGDGAPPLSVVSSRIVLTRVVAAARKDAEAAPAALFAAEARVVFAPERFADVWDRSFQGVALVRDFRSANEALEAARKAAAEPQGPRPGDAGTEADMILLERARGRVGPWRGWVQSLDEKENRRQPAARRDIYVDRYEVTCAQYAAFVLAQKPTRREELLPDGWKLGEDGALTYPEGAARRPVTGVTYAQALAYARHWGKRLPTEDEWELAAAGVEDEGRTFPWGSETGDVEFAAAGTVRAPVDVDRFPGDVTPEGIVGMAGNVAEWVATLPDRQDAPKARAPKSDEVIIRGGSFRAKADECSTLWRWVADPARPHPQVGFRCVMDEREYRRRFE